MSDKPKEPLNAQGINLGTRAGMQWARLRDASKGFWHPNNLDRRFPYQVPRTVTVQDFRLGGSFLFFQFCIAIFIFVYQMLDQGGHIAFEGPFGQVSFQVKRPTGPQTPISGENSYWNLSDSQRTAAASGFLPTSQLPYCYNLTGPNQFCSEDPLNTSYYCKPGSCINPYTRCNGPAIPLQVLRCRYFDEEWIAPVIQERSILVVSRLSTMQQNVMCQDPPDDNTPCVYLFEPEAGTPVKYHAVMPEFFEIMFDHQVFTPTNGVEGKQENAPDAPLVFQDGRIFYPASIDPAGNGSFYRDDDKPWIPGYYNILGRHSISVNTLLQASGLGPFDGECTGLFDSGSTWRYTGVTILLRITYSNYQNWGLVTTTYPFYQYSAETGTTYAAVHSVTRDANTSFRLFENRHGIKIYITQEGSLGAFSPVNLMFFLGGAVATLAIASIVVDNIVLRFFIPEKVKQIIDLASATTVPCREDLNSYLKAVEEHMGGNYTAPVTFWEVEKEFLDHQEVTGKLTKRPDFKTAAAAQLQTLMESARVERLKSGADEKTDQELVAAGALAFARSITPPAQEPALHRSMSNIVRERWKLAKTGVFAELHERQARARAQPQYTTLAVPTDGGSRRVSAASSTDGARRVSGATTSEEPRRGSGATGFGSPTYQPLE